jgi:hypothetical protein
MKKPFTLSPKAEELIAKMEAREAAKKKADEKASAHDTSKPAPIVGMGPNPLDTLGKVGCGK